MTFEQAHALYQYCEKLLTEIGTVALRGNGFIKVPKLACKFMYESGEDEVSQGVLQVDSAQITLDPRRNNALCILVGNTYGEPMNIHCLSHASKAPLLERIHVAVQANEARANELRAKYGF